MVPLDLLVPEPAGRFGGEPPRNAFVELHNLIAAAQSPADFGPADRVRISRRHHVDLASDFLGERVALYQALLDHRITDSDLGRADRRLLAHVAATLALTPSALRPAHERAFGTAVSEAVSDDCLSVEERLHLYKLQHLLGLDPRIADGAYDVLARERLMRAIAEALCDGLLSPDEEAEIERVRADLSLDIPDPVGRMLQVARDRWKIRHGEAPVAEVDLDLESGEIGRMQTEARWAPVDIPRFQRHVGERALMAGRTATLTVPRHLHLRRARSGTVILTDRRVILQPTTGLPDEIRIEHLFQILRFQNGTVLRTKSERHVYIDPAERNEIFYALLHHTLFGAEGASAGPSRPKRFRAQTSRSTSETPSALAVAPKARAPRWATPARNAVWRKVLTAEVRKAERHVFFAPRPTTIVDRLAERRTPWDGPGRVSVSDTVLRFTGESMRRTRRYTIDKVVRSGALVWVHRRGSHDWLIRCRRASEAAALARLLTDRP